MKNSLKLSSLALVAVSAMLGMQMTSCGETDVVNIWGPSEHEQVYLDAAAKYKEAHPEFKAEVKFANLGDAGANGNISKDIETAGEIYTFPNDQLIDLKSMGALCKLPAAKAQSIKENHVAAAVSSAKVGDDYYAYPVTADNGFVFIYNKDAFKDTKVWNSQKNGLKDGYTFRELFAALDERGAQAGHEKWANGTCIWPCGTAWYQCGMYFAVGSDYDVKFDESGKQLESTCNFAYDLLDDGSKNYERGFEAIRCMVNSYTNEDGTVNKHFVYTDDGTYNAYANNNSAADCTEPLAGIVCWNNGNLLTNWGDDYACEVLPTLVAQCAQYGGSGKKYTWRSFSGFKLMGVNPYSVYARKSEECLLQLHDFAEYLTGYEASIARFEVSNSGPSNIDAKNDAKVQTSPFLTALNKQYDIKDQFGNPGYRVQDCVPQNFWTPIANLGNGVFNYVNAGDNASQYKNTTALQKELYNLQKSICQTV